MLLLLLLVLHLLFWRCTQARALYEEVVAGRAATVGPGHPSTLMAQGNLALLLAEQLGEREAAVRLLRAVVVGFSTALGFEHTDTLATKMLLAGLLLDGVAAAAAACGSENVDACGDGGGKGNGSGQARHSGDPVAAASATAVTGYSQEGRGPAEDEDGGLWTEEKKALIQTQLWDTENKGGNICGGFGFRGVWIC